MHRDSTTYLVMEIWFKVLQKSWNSIGQHVYEPCTEDMLLADMQMLKSKRQKSSSPRTLLTLKEQAEWNRHHAGQLSVAPVAEIVNHFASSFSQLGKLILETERFVCPMA